MQNQDLSVPRFLLEGCYIYIRGATYISEIIYKKISSEHMKKGISVGLILVWVSLVKAFWAKRTWGGNKAVNAELFWCEAFISGTAIMFPTAVFLMKLFSLYYEILKETNLN